MNELETSLIALLEASDKTQTAQAAQLKAQNEELRRLGNELSTVHSELRTLNEENTRMALSLEQLQKFLEPLLESHRQQETRLTDLRSKLPSG